jgi:hypothetical protein
VSHDPELQKLLQGLPDAEREALLEEHRQLEKDLLRLADPPPPADFVQKVMAKVAAAPAQAPSRAEVGLAAMITFTAAALGLMLLANHASVEGLSLSFAQVLVWVREAAIGVSSAFAAVWRTSALPLSLALCAALITSVVTLKKVWSAS